MISRSTHQSFTKHVWKLTNEGIGQLITLIQRTIATMKECGVDSIDTLYMVIAELHMPDDFFRYWMEKTVKAKSPPTADRLVELLQQYRLHLQGRTIDSPSVSKHSTAPLNKQNRGKPQLFMFKRKVIAPCVMMVATHCICLQYSRQNQWRKNSIQLAG